MPGVVPSRRFYTLPSLRRLPAPRVAACHVAACRAAQARAFERIVRRWMSGTSGTLCVPVAKPQPGDQPGTMHAALTGIPQSPASIESCNTSPGDGMPVDTSVGAASQQAPIAGLETGTNFCDRFLSRRPPVGSARLPASPTESGMRLPQRLQAGHATSLETSGAIRNNFIRSVQRSSTSSTRPRRAVYSTSPLPCIHCTRQQGLKKGKCKLCAALYRERGCPTVRGAGPVSGSVDPSRVFRCSAGGV